MKTILLALVVGFVLSAPAPPADVSGVWTLNFHPDLGGEPSTTDCTFRQKGTRLTIQCGRGAPSTGNVHGQRVTFVTKTGLHGELQATIEADLNADATTMKGTWRLVDQDKKDRRGTFNATKRSNADARQSQALTPE